MSHIRRGEQMKNTYWDQFMVTGSISDYLSYKMERETSERRREAAPDSEEDSENKGRECFCCDVPEKTKQFGSGKSS